CSTGGKAAAGVDHW
nr:immunoglobulin heavy chain junction region [Macaca mulatta]MOV52608.1 immunoglobulin heavy chain junction region [Macaca mulatta]